MDGWIDGGMDGWRKDQTQQNVRESRGAKAIGEPQPRQIADLWRYFVRHSLMEREKRCFADAEGGGGRREEAGKVRGEGTKTKTEFLLPVSLSCTHVHESHLCDPCIYA